MVTRDDFAETLLGLAVVIVAGLFLVFALQRGGVQGGPAGYGLSATFPRADGMAPGTEVRLSGVKVGAVTGVELLPEQFYWVRVNFTVRSDVKIPADSTARISSDGLLGGWHIAIESGASQTMLADGGQIEQTEGSVDAFGLLGEVLEGMVSRLEQMSLQGAPRP